MCLWNTLWCHDTIDLCHLKSILQWFRLKCRQQSFDVRARQMLLTVLPAMTVITMLPLSNAGSREGGMLAWMESILTVCNTQHFGEKDILFFCYFRIMLLSIPLDPGVYIYSICDLKRISPRLFVILSAILWGILAFWCIYCSTDYPAWLVHTNWWWPWACTPFNGTIYLVVEVAK